MSDPKPTVMPLWLIVAGAVIGVTLLVMAAATSAPAFLRAAWALAGVGCLTVARAQWITWRRTKCDSGTRR